MLISTPDWLCTEFSLTLQCIEASYVVVTRISFASATLRCYQHAQLAVRQRG